MNEIPDHVWLSAFLAGLFSAPHCLGMCGGISLLLTGNTHGEHQQKLLLLSHHVGRLLAYTTLGVLAGMFGYLIAASTFHGFEIVSRALVAITLVLLAIHIAQLAKPYAFLEKMGGKIWQRMAPNLNRMLPINNVPKALLAGYIWGFIPCGMVYAALTLALASGHSESAAYIMATFGLGTLPVMLTASLVGDRLIQWRPTRIWRWLAAVTLIVLAGTAVVLPFQHASHSEGVHPPSHHH